MDELERFLGALTRADVVAVRRMLTRSASLAVARFAPESHKNPPMFVAVRVAGFDGHGEQVSPRLKKDAARAKLVALLARHGADVNHRYARGVRPLHMAARYGLHRCIAVLLKLGADIDARDTEQETALFRAANLGHAAAVATLIAHGANADLPNRQGQKPIDRARRKGFTGIVEQLLDASLATRAEPAR